MIQIALILFDQLLAVSRSDHETPCHASMQNNYHCLQYVLRAVPGTVWKFQAAFSYKILEL